MRRTLLVIVAVMALSACAAWDQQGFDAGKSGTSTFASSVNPGNVGSLSHVFTDADPAGSGLTAAVSGGKVFALGQSLFAFDAGGCSGTVPASCAPIWRSNSNNFNHELVVGGGKVWVINTHLTPTVQGFDPSGASCPTPTTCGPVTTITTPHGAPVALRWIGDVLHVTENVGSTSNPNDPSHQYEYAYAADGTLRWQADLGVSPAAFYATHDPVADGDTVFLGLPLGTTRAYDNRGITNCSGTPTTCLPMWSLPADSTADAARAGRLYAFLGSGPTGGISAFDSKGVQGCSGSPKVCQPLWTTPTGTGFQAVDDTHLFGRNVDDGLVDAFALDGTGCSGSPRVCQPQWSNAPGVSGSAGAYVSSVAGGLLYTSSDICDDASCTTRTWYVDAHDAAGSVGCSGAPKVCHSLFAKAIGFRPSNIMIVGDVVYVVGDSSTINQPNPAIYGFRTS